MAQYPPQTDFTEVDPTVAAAIAGITPAAIGAATPASVAAAVAGVTPASLGVPTNAQLSSAVSAVTAASLGVPTTGDLSAAIAGITPASIGAATPASVAAAVAGLAATSYVDAGDAGALKLATNVTQVVIPTANVVPLTLQGSVGGAADLQQWVNGAGATLVKIGSSGRVIVGADASARVNVSPTAANQTPLVVRGFSSQSNNLLELQSSAAAVLVSVSSAGDITAPNVKSTYGRFGSDLSFQNSGVLRAIANNTTDPVAVLRGAASQAANLQEWQDSTSAVMASVSAGGTVTAPALRAVGVFSSAVPMAVQAAAGQNVDMQRWQDSGAAVKSSVNAFGSLLIRTTAQFGSAAISAQTPSVTSEGIVVRGMASQSANLQEWQDSTPTTVAFVNGGGSAKFARLAVGLAGIPTTTAFFTQSRQTTESALVAKAIASQTANTQEWQDSGGVAQGSFSAGGTMRALNLAVGNSASAAGGANVLAIQNAATAPSSNPASGGVIYAEAGALKYRGSSGTVTVLAVA